MKRIFKGKILFAISFIAVFIAAVFSVACKEDDTRTFKFTEQVGTISNPGIGYTTTDWYHTAVGDTKPRDKQGDIVLFFIDLSPFSSGANGKGVDYDLDERFFTSLRATFENCRNNGSTVAVRFRYDENGKSDPEPASFGQVLKHISQIKSSGVLQDYKDILMFVESGFVGKWGEQHGGKYTDVEHKAKLLKAMLDCVPSPVPVTVRTPDTFAKYVGLDRSELADYVAEKGSDAARVGLYNDGYMGSDTDLGTYANREIETQWLSNQTAAYFGGEFSGNIEFAKKYDAYLPENCIPEMYKTHLSYVNGNIFELYKDYVFDKNYDVAGFDNSAYYGQSVFRFIRDHLGYRFVLTESSFPKTVERGGNLEFSFTVTNNGFANPIKKQNCEVIFEKDGRFVKTEVGLDPTQWYSGSIVKNQPVIKLPALMEAGEWKVYFKSSVGVNPLSQYGFRSVRFASNDVWNEALGANYLGFVEITASEGNIADNGIGEAGKALKPAHLYSFGGKTVIDGARSDGEWSEDEAITDNGQYRLYAKCDEDNLYIMADVPHCAKAPVFNFRAKNEDNGQTYWLYRQSNGFIYFNHDDKTGHAGLSVKYSDNLCEFAIPFYMLELTGGTTLSGISVSVQDSEDGWKGTGSVKLDGSYEIRPDFTLFNAVEKPTVSRGDGYGIVLETDADVKEVVWYLDGRAIEDESSATFKLFNIQTDCVVSAKITTAKGSVKQAVLAEIKVK